MVSNPLVFGHLRYLGTDVGHEAVMQLIQISNNFLSKYKRYLILFLDLTVMH